MRVRLWTKELSNNPGTRRAIKTNKIATSMTATIDCAHAKPIAPMLSPSANHTANPTFSKIAKIDTYNGVFVSCSA
ncbi:hypothetical protein D3C87_1620220 [compost metagenome]